MTAFIWVEKTLGGVDILINSASATASVPIVGKVQATISRFIILLLKSQRALLTLLHCKRKPLTYCAKYFNTNMNGKNVTLECGSLLTIQG